MNFSATPVGTHCCRRGKSWRAVWLATAIAVTGFQTGHAQLDIFRRGYHPNNVFAYPPKLPLDFRRLALLPVAAGSTDGALPDGCAALGPVLLDQLIKTKRFEIVPVDSDTLRRGTGQGSWTGRETLPTDFLSFLRRQYDCDGVLFAELTCYHAYAPLAVGWRFKLVDARSGQIIWAADEIFDASEPTVRRAAQNFENQHFHLPFVHEDNWQALNSPRQFGRYVITTLLGSLPSR
jgi:hypothetical protein